MICSSQLVLLPIYSSPLSVKYKSLQNSLLYIVLTLFESRILDTTVVCSDLLVCHRIDILFTTLCEILIEKKELINRLQLILTYKRLR